MSYPANLRGWGPGWPTNRIKDQVWVTAHRSGVRFLVHHVLAPLLKHVIDEVERRGYLLHVDGDTPDDWSFVSRPIANTREPSNHSWGLAVDIDATKYPQGQRKRNPPAWVVELFEANGFEWGGRWRRADPMHFEYRESISQARWRVAALAAHTVERTPAPIPASAPAPVPEPDLPPIVIPRCQPMFLCKINPEQAQSRDEKVAIYYGDGIERVRVGSDANNKAVRDYSDILRFRGLPHGVAVLDRATVMKMRDVTPGVKA